RVHLLRRVSGGTESLVDLFRRELTKQAADPLHVRARDVPSDPSQPPMNSQLLRVQDVNQGRTRRRHEVYVSRRNFANKAGTGVDAYIALGSSVRPARPRSAKT